MYEIERLTAADYDELLEFLNVSFEHYGERSFDKALPAMWHRDDEHMGKHLAIRDGGKIVAAMGIYPLRTVIAGHELVFATTGNVATLPEYRGKGHMKALMTAAMAELPRLGIDVARLGGQRQRYERYGFADVGVTRHYKLTAKNIAGYEPKIAFRPITREDKSSLEFASKVQSSQPFAVQRGSSDNFYDVMCAWGNRPFIALSDGEPLGVLSVSPNLVEIAEHFSVDGTSDYEMLKSWLTVNKLESINCTASPWDVEFSRLIGVECENLSLSAATKCRVERFDKLCNALLALRREDEIPSGEFAIEIEGRGILRFEGRSCELVENVTPDLTLDALTATRFLLGCESPDAVCGLPKGKAAYIRAVFPLPMGWNLQDRV